jgi:uncharacterized protein YvpB
MMPPLLPVRLIRQEELSGCLAACAQMALAHIGVNVTQRELNRLFGLTQAGVPASRVQLLTRYSVEVVYASGDEATLRNELDQRQPVIVFLSTGDLPHWSSNVQHAVLLVGYDDTNVYLHDPVFGEAPQSVTWGELLLAWSEFDYRYACLKRR